MNIDLSELMRISTMCADINNTIITGLSSVNANLDEICANVNSSSLESATNNLKDSISQISKTVSDKLPTVQTFLNEQLSKYSADNAEAKARLDQLMSTIGNSFGGK